MTVALNGIKVIDCSQVAAVPLAARILGDFGADVIHIENTITGDYWRYFKDTMAEAKDGPPSDFDYNWENYNRNKRSCTVDLNTEGGRAIVHKMVKEADVFLSNLRTFELERFQMDYETVNKINPRIIWGSVNGYGKEGSDKELPAYDLTAYYARAGIPYLLSVPGIPTFGYRPASGDNVVAMALAYGIVQALYVREKTGEGQQVDVSLMHTALYQMGFDVSGALITGLDPVDYREEIPEAMVEKAMQAIAPIWDILEATDKNPLSGMYMTKDARALIFVILQPDRYWVKFCNAVDRPDLAENPKYQTIQGRAEDVVELRQIFAEIFMTKTYEKWHPLLEGIPYAPNQSLKEAINDPKAIASGCFAEYNHPTQGHIRQVANPVMMSKTPAGVRMPAPEFGQHTEEVLIEYGFSWEDIAHFKERGVIA